MGCPESRVRCRDGRDVCHAQTRTALHTLATKRCLAAKATPGKGFGNATLLLYLAVTYTVQRLVRQGRARRDALPAVAAVGERWM
jgi:uncharacterized protein involved in high-affinity Fe2+ transport